MKMNAIILLSLIFLLNGCAGPDLPKINDKKGLSELNIQEIANEFKLKKISPQQYRGLYYKSIGKPYYLDRYLSAYCESINNVYIGSYDDLDGNLEIKACKASSDVTPLFLLFIKHEHFYNGEYDDKAALTLDISDTAKNNWVIEKQKKEKEIKESIRRAAAERQTKIEEGKRQIIEEEKRILGLKQRSGQQTMNFYTSWRFIGDSDKCRNTCAKENQKQTGYLTLQDALNDGWHFKATLNQISMSVDEQCICDGTITILDK